MLDVFATIAFLVQWERDLHTQAHAAYREAKAGLRDAQRIHLGADRARTARLVALAGVPREAVYNIRGEPQDRLLRTIEQELVQAVADVDWWRGVVAAQGEIVKGAPIADVLERQAAA